MLRLVALYCAGALSAIKRSVPSAAVETVGTDGLPSGPTAADTSWIVPSITTEGNQTTGTDERQLCRLNALNASATASANGFLQPGDCAAHCCGGHGLCLGSAPPCTEGPCVWDTVRVLLY